MNFERLEGIFLNLVMMMSMQRDADEGRACGHFVYAHAVDHFTASALQEHWQAITALEDFKYCDGTGEVLDMIAVHVMEQMYHVSLPGKEPPEFPEYLSWFGMKALKSWGES